MENAVTTTHGLDFAQCDYDSHTELLDAIGIVNDDPWPQIPWKLYRVGTCHGQYRATPEAYEILSIINDQPGNGHLDDVLEWFEYACRRSNLPLRFLAFTNERFMYHLIAKRGFKPFGIDNVEKYFT